jgi:hypothetical protein
VRISGSPVCSTSRRWARGRRANADFETVLGTGGLRRDGRPSLATSSRYRIYSIMDLFRLRSEMSETHVTERGADAIWDRAEPKRIAVEERSPHEV